MDWLQNLWSWISGSGGSQQQPKDPGAQTAAAPGPPGTTAQMAGGSASTSASGQRSSGNQAMTSDFAKILAASLLTPPSLTYPRTPDMPKVNPFVYSPDKTTPLGPRASLARY